MEHDAHRQRQSAQELEVRTDLGVVAHLFKAELDEVVLTVGHEHVLLIVVITLLVLGVFLRFRSQLIFVTFDEEAAQLAGIRVNLMLTGYYILLALVIIASIRAVGIILVNALLIIPAATAKM